MADTVDNAVDATIGMLVLALVAIPIGAVPYYENLPDSITGAPDYLMTILEAIPAVMFVGVLLGLFSKFR